MMKKISRRKLFKISGLLLGVTLVSPVLKGVSALLPKEESKEIVLGDLSKDVVIKGNSIKLITDQSENMTAIKIDSAHSHSLLPINTDYTALHIHQPSTPEEMTGLFSRARIDI